ncbi:hypothetical protein D6855_09285 [Butyrivibrio sp. CB08]|uniref:hypothetical protein n=1 Tax=Butyrivibrio sp. CB08 TaxID=2364879 RepID=UPI000EA97A7E|nr:hypothetical protein [Butyrivibrio sp. CB08]RKM59960.1 hypothetical protein D6855_09285 [Butyrivibrio sp. CB08]
MKKSIAMIMTGLMVLSLTACGQAAPAEAPAAEETEQAAAEASVESTEIANPWRDASEEECRQLVGNGFSAPEGATNVKWSVMDSGDPYRQLVQMTFDLDDKSFTARQQATGDNAEDLSGMYFDWTVEDDVTLANWAGGNMAGKCKRFIGDTEWVDVCTWYDVETGDSYSLSTTAKDLDGFDIQAIAEAIYDPNKQFGANAPEESGELQEHIPMVNLDGCDTFTQIVDKLPAGSGYTNIKLGDTDVLLVASWTFDDLEGHNAAIDAEVYSYTDSGTPQYAGFVEAAGTAYPLAVNNDKLYVGGNHFMKVYTSSYGFPCWDEFAWEEFDTDGKATYYYRSDLHDIADVGADENGVLKDNSVLSRLYDECFSGEILNFDVIK